MKNMAPLASNRLQAPTPRDQRAQFNLTVPDFMARRVAKYSNHPRKTDTAPIRSMLQVAVGEQPAYGELSFRLVGLFVGHKVDHGNADQGCYR